MKALLLLTITFFLSLPMNIIGQSGWTDQTPDNIDISDTALQGICTINSENIWVVGQHGCILHSTNGGEDWVKVSTDYDDDFLSVIFLDSNIGFITGIPRYDDYAFFLKTEDGGTTWTRTHLPSGGGQIAFDLDYYFLESNQKYTIYITGGLGYIWKSEDMGVSWDILAGGCGNGNFNACCIIDENTGWFVGTPSTTEDITIMNTTDGGGLFTVQVNPNDIKLNDVSFINSTTGIAVGLENQIIHTIDGGGTWTNKMTLLNHRWQACDMKSSGKAWVVGKNGKAAHSTDFGDNWTEQNTGHSSELWEVYFIDDNEGWALGGGIGADGLILHTTSGGVATNIDELSADKANYLEQNYPNPVTTNTHIKYQIEQPGKVTIALYDLAGNKIEYLVDETKSAGIYTIEFINSYPSGIYLYELRLNSELLQTRKMIIKK